MPETTVVALLFTDIVGSTELGQRLGDQRAEEVRRAHIDALRGPISTHGGTEVKNLGDGLMVAFASPSQALSCAVAMQQAVERANRRSDYEIGLRVGLHLGEVTKHEGDYFGMPVVVAERLCKTAEGGRVLASDAVRFLVGTRAPHELKPLGEVALKGIDEPVAAFEVLWEPAAEPIPMPSAISREPQGGGFVARDAELDRIRERWTGAQVGERQLVLLAGEPGIGKTRLATEFARAAHAEGATVLFGRCDEETPIPYQPWVEALGQYISAVPDDELAQLGDHSELTWLVPQLTDRLPELRVPEAADAETERYRLFSAVSSFLAEVTRTSPLVLVLDDIHWADRPSLLLLRHVIRSHDPAALLICGTYRETELARTHPLADVLAELRRERAVERIHLSGLEQPEIVDWLTGAIGHELGRRGFRLVEELHKATEGNPFFLEQVMAHLVEAGRFIQRDGIWTFDERLENLGIPEGVKEVIGRRLSRQSDECNAALANASVLGREFEFDVLARMIDLDDDALLSAIDQALGAQLIVDSRSSGAPRYTFTHALVRETLYEELSVPRKQRLHLRAGQAMEAVHSDELDQHLAELAIHYRTAGTSGPLDKAIDYSVRAGRAAQRLFAYEDAASHWLAALELTEDDHERAEPRARLLEAVGDLMYVTGIDYRKGIECLEQALDIYDSLGDEERAAQVHSRLGRNRSTFPQTMDISRAVDHYRAAEVVLSRTTEGAPLGYLYVGLAGASLWAIEVEQGLVACEKAIDIGRRTGNEALWAEGTAMRAWAVGIKGQFGEARGLVEESWAVADRLDHPYAAFVAAWIGGFVEACKLNWHGVVDWTDRELGKSRQAQAHLQREQLLGQKLMARLSVDGVADVPAEETAGAVEMMSIYLAQCEGRWKEAAEASELWLRGAEAVGNRLMVCGNCSALAGVRFLLGDLDGADSLLRRGAAVAAGYWWGELNLVSALASNRALEGHCDEAADLVGRSRRLLAASDDPGGTTLLVDLAEALTAACRGNPADADRLFGSALETMRRYPSGWSEGEALRQWGCVLMARGERDGAAARFDAALDFFRSKGFGEPWIDRVLADRSKL